MVTSIPSCPSKSLKSRDALFASVDNRDKEEPSKERKKEKYSDAVLEGHATFPRRGLSTTYSLEGVYRAICEGAPRRSRIDCDPRL